jgi:hypothetical protein
MAQKRKPKPRVEEAPARPRPNDVGEFVRAFGPCGPGARALMEGPASDGSAPGKTMAEAWQRSVVGSWLEWILRKTAPNDAAVRAQLGALRKAHLGPLVMAKARRDVAVPGRTKDQAKAAKAEYENLEKQAQKDYANAIRSEFPNPFK